MLKRPMHRSLEPLRFPGAEGMGSRAAPTPKVPILHQRKPRASPVLWKDADSWSLNWQEAGTRLP